jgi:hypothetical protein
MRIFGRPRSAVVAALALASLGAGGMPAHAAESWPTDGGDAGSTVTVGKPDDQSATVGVPITPIRIDASDSDASRILVYTATGLPEGLVMSSVIGAISGTPTAAGRSTVTVTVSDGTGPTGSTSFGWTVAPGETLQKPIDGGTYMMRLAGTTEEVGDLNSSTTSGGPLVVHERHTVGGVTWTGLSHSDGSFTFRSATSLLCLDVEDPSAGAGAAIVQALCTGASDQNWVLEAAGGGFELVNASTGLAIATAGTSSPAPLTQQQSGAAWAFSRLN